MDSEKEGASAPPPSVLFPSDLALFLKLLPRAQIVVGDIPHIYPAMTRLEKAVQTQAVFIEERPGGETSER